ncbi:MAG: hypothetical protein P4L84_13850 [Isosphaeraceae bacterium]|nr:hypothetical protein [Isosphaeraceae bacterium]
MSDEKQFHYQPTCSAPDCGQPAVYKVAAPWSSGSSRELKNYGLACEVHRDSQLARGMTHQQGLVLADGETVGKVGLYRLEPGKRDVHLARLPDH